VRDTHHQPTLWLVLGAGRQFLVAVQDLVAIVRGARPSFVPGLAPPAIGVISFRGDVLVVLHPDGGAVSRVRGSRIAVLGQEGQAWGLWCERVAPADPGIAPLSLSDLLGKLGAEADRGP
jgi:hypothetical protein